MIYFDNSATTYPKPESVLKGVATAVKDYGGNPGRSGHSLSIKTAEKVFEVRKLAGDFFQAQVENTVFTLNATHALNMAIKGIMEDGGHIIMSSLEHNSVSRPIIALADSRKIEYSIAKIFENDDETLAEIESLIRADTKCVCISLASNVTGQILPYKKIGELCKKHNICYIGDASQVSGVLPVTLADGFNFICTSGHKGLYGPTGTGLLICDGKYNLKTIIEGGTGATSGELVQTEFLPERLESGTINTVGIIGLGEGIKFVNQKGVENISRYENALCDRLISRISNNDNIKIYRNNAKFVGIVAFNVKDVHSQNTARVLSNMGFGLRGGLQCAAVAHNFLNTNTQGVVRFSPSVFNTPKQVDMLSNAILKIARNPEKY